MCFVLCVRYLHDYTLSICRIVMNEQQLLLVIYAPHIKKFAGKRKNNKIHRNSQTYFEFVVSECKYLCSISVKKWHSNKRHFFDQCLSFS